MNIFFRWVITAVAFYGIAMLLPGVHVASGVTALWLAFFWGVVNVFVKPILMLFTLPINLLSLGLFTLIINGFLFWLLSTFVKGFVVDSFGAAFLGALILSLVSWATSKLGERGE